MLLIPGDGQVPVATGGVCDSIASSAMGPSTSLLYQSGITCFLVTRLRRWVSHLLVRPASASRFDSTDVWHITSAGQAGSD